MLPLQEVPEFDAEHDLLRILGVHGVHVLRDGEHP